MSGAIIARRAGGPVHRTAILGFALLLACALAHPPTVRAQTVEIGVRLETAEREVYAGDSVVVDIQAVGLIAPLDTSPLLANAELLRETVGTRIAVLGGKVAEVRTRRMELLPRGEGVLTLGPLSGEIESGPVRSNALTVTVLPPIDERWTPDASDARAEVRVSKADPWVRERVVLDIVLHHRFAIADERVALPGLDGFDVLPVFERRRPAVTAEADGAAGGTEDDADADGGPPLRRIEWRYLLWPVRSGPLTIGPVRWSGTMVRSRTARGPIEVGTEPLTLDVRAAPADANGWWLPARGVRLSDAWSGDLADLTAGQEIVRTLTLEADGVLASQLPDVVPLASRSFTSVALGATREQTLAGDRVAARGTYEFRMTARSPVPVFLDTVRVPWWDVEADAAAEAIVPARRVDIGLPDRADLLADVALGQGLWSRAWLTLASVPVPATAGIACALLLGAGLAATAWRRPSGRGGRGGADDSGLPPI